MAGASPVLGKVDVACANPSCRSRAVTRMLHRHDTFRRDGTTVAFEYDLVQCSSCGLAFVHPLPGEEQVAAFYPRDYDYWQEADRVRRRDRLKSVVASWRYPEVSSASPKPWWYPRRALARLAERGAARDISLTLAIPSAMPPEAAVMDFGCGAGGFLLTLRARGFRSLRGVDVSSNARGLGVLRAHEIEVGEAASLRDQPAEAFDCIRLEHVFEHFRDPVAIGRDLVRLLRVGGLLVMTVPSVYPFLPLRDLERNPALPHMQLPLHLWHHTAESLAGFVASLGLRVERLRRLRPFGYLTVAARRTSTSVARRGAG